MLNYTIRRLLLTIPTLIGVAVLIFFVLRVVPGDIVEIRLRAEGAAVPQHIIERERANLGLDRPLVVQFGAWMAGLAQADLGQSMWTRRPVVSEVGVRLELSLQIAVMATIIGILVAVPLGTLSALYANTWLDYAIRVLTLGGLAVPAFWFGMLLVMSLIFLFNWLPPIGYRPIYVDPLANLSQLIWPALAVGYRFAAVLARMVRSSVMEVLREDYIRTARAKGLSERMVVARHALRNAMLPPITVIGLEFAFLIGGLVVTEQVFNLNGLGQLLISAVSHNDFVMIQGIVMILAAIFIVVNLMIDLLYSLIDPRIRYA